MEGNLNPVGHDESIVLDGLLRLQTRAGCVRLKVHVFAPATGTIASQFPRPGPARALARRSRSLSVVNHFELQHPVTSMHHSFFMLFLYIVAEMGY